MESMPKPICFFIMSFQDHFSD